MNKSIIRLNFNDNLYNIALYHNIREDNKVIKLGVNEIGVSSNYVDVVTTR